MIPLRLENRACEIASTADRMFRRAGRRGRICRTRRAAQRRTGTILVFVLVCLLVVTTILMGAVEVSIRNRRQIRTEIQLEQTYWLLDAGIGAAITKFNQSPDFAEYAFATEGTLKNYRGSVNIEVIERTDQSVRLRVTAQLLGRQEFSPVTQRSRVIVLDNRQTNQTKTITNRTDEGNKR